MKFLHKKFSCSSARTVGEKKSLQSFGRIKLALFLCSKTKPSAIASTKKGCQFLYPNGRGEKKITGLLHF